MNTDALFSSKSVEWYTPADFFDRVSMKHDFTLDVCATAENAKTDRFFDIEANGLSQSWGSSVCWMNPPYGREIKHWMKKAHGESLLGSTVVCLVPSRTDTAWWHDYAMKAHEIEYIRGRLKFGGAKNSAPFPSALVTFRPPSDDRLDLLPIRVRLADLRDKTARPGSPRRTDSLAAYHMNSFGDLEALVAEVSRLRSCLDMAEKGEAEDEVARLRKEVRRSKDAHSSLLCTLRELVTETGPVYPSTT
jgi:site-specific DNA-methyltransferase (adenine-specific)